MENLNSNSVISLYERNLQKGYINLLINTLKESKTQSTYSKRNEGKY